MDKETNIGKESNEENCEVFNLKSCADAVEEATDTETTGDASDNEEFTDAREVHEEFTDAKEVHEELEYDETCLKEMYANKSEIELQELKGTSNKVKADGNQQFKNGDFVEAIKLYTTALNYCPLEFKTERSILYANRAAAKIGLEQHKEAVVDCDKAIELNPQYLKAIMRRAQLHRKLENLESALEDYKRVLELDRSCREAAQECMVLPDEINERNEKLKKEMMGQLKNLGNMFLKPFGLSTNNFNMVQDPNTGGYSINFQNNPTNNNKSNED